MELPKIISSSRLSSQKSFKLTDDRIKLEISREKKISCSQFQRKINRLTWFQAQSMYKSTSFYDV